METSHRLNENFENFSNDIENDQFLESNDYEEMTENKSCYEGSKKNCRWTEEEVKF
jgi:hypothetical protein